jgi:hypothetical protein
LTTLAAALASLRYADLDARWSRLLSGWLGSAPALRTLPASLLAGGRLCAGRLLSKQRLTEHGRQEERARDEQREAIAH